MSENDKTPPPLPQRWDDALELNAQTDDAPTADDVVLYELTGKILECIRDEYEKYPPDPSQVDALEMIAAGVWLAWAMSIDWLIRSSGDKVLTVERLDDAMLPLGTSDERLYALSGGLVDGSFMRPVLKRLKAKLPAGKILPDEMVEVLRNDGITVD